MAFAFIPEKPAENSASRPSPNKQPAAQYRNQHRRSKDSPMTSQKTNDRLDGRGAKDDTQSAVDHICQCFATNLLTLFTTKLSHHGSPKTRWATSSVKLSQRFNSFGRR